MSLISNLMSKQPDLADFENFIVKTEGENSKWGRIVCKWIEKKEERNLVHIFTPLINMQTGEIFLDCSKKKIYIKFLAHTILRPFHILFKTVYHCAIPISIPTIINETYQQGIKEKKSSGEIAKTCLKNSFNSLVDIVRTPLYGVAMTIVNIAALVIGPLAPKHLYDLREITGKLVQSLNRTKTTAPDFFKCFQHITTLSGIKKWNRINDDTNYLTNASESSIGLSNFARAQVSFLRNHYSICNNPFAKLGPNKTYKSASYGDVEKAGYVDCSHREETSL